MFFCRQRFCCVLISVLIPLVNLGPSLPTHSGFDFHITPGCHSYCGLNNSTYAPNSPFIPDSACPLRKFFDQHFPDSPCGTRQLLSILGPENFRVTIVIAGQTVARQNTYDPSFVVSSRLVAFLELHVIRNANGACLMFRVSHPANGNL